MPQYIQTHPAFVSYNWTVDAVVNAARLILFLSFTILQEQGVSKIAAHEKTLLNSKDLYLQKWQLTATHAQI